MLLIPHIRLALLTLLLCAAAHAQPGITAEQTAFFEDEVRPVLQENCFKCHGGEDEIQGGLILTSRGGVVRGGDRGPVVNFEDPAKSILLDMISWRDENHQMPPPGKLQQWDIDALTEWVEQGIPWPGGETEPIEPPLPHGLTRESPELWAFRPVRESAVPKVSDPAWSQNSIDAFIYAKLERAGLKPAPPASKRAIIRRVYYSVTGLPPSPAQVEAFVADESPEAYEKLVDQLLASPHYGEQWARHWLDLVRYADSNGYERDSDKPYIWRYRDYVIDAFNSDRPYDRFVKEQLAGDELDKANPESITATGYYYLGLWDDEPADPLQARYDGLDDIVDTTSRVFLGITMGCARCHGHKLDPIPQADYYRFLAFFQGLKPMQRTTGNGILTSILPPDEQREYERKVAEKRDAEFQLLREQNELLEEFKAALARKKPELLPDKDVGHSKLEQLQYKFYRSAWDSLPDFDLIKPETTGALEHGYITTAPASRPDDIGFVFEGLLNVELEGDYAFTVDANGGYRLLIAGKEVIAHREPKPRRDEGTIVLAPGLAPFRLEFFVNEGPPRLWVGWAPRNANFRKDLSRDPEKVIDDGDLRKLVDEQGNDLIGKKKSERIAELAKLRAEVRAREIPGKWAPSAKELGPEPGPTHILIRGNPHAPGRDVTPGYPRIFDAPSPTAPSPYAAEDTSGRRRQLAEWIASPNNPLTARVMVNRIWQYHFGRGIVKSSNNFGVIGDDPTHPELLDWLAAEFVRSGWSIKHMHRLILTSQAYRMSSGTNEAAFAKDPANQLLWRFDMRRLTAEEIRDSMLAAGGTLNLAMHGAGVYPELPEEVVKTSSMNANLEDSGTWGKSTPEESARRSIYVHVKRSLLLPIMTDFDQADPQASCPVRFSTTQPTQALSLLNSQFAHEQAALLAERLRNEAGDDETRIRRGFELVTSRPATQHEIARGMQFSRELQEEDGLPENKAFERFCLLLLNLNEFVYLE